MFLIRAFLTIVLVSFSSVLADNDPPNFLEGTEVNDLVSLGYVTVEVHDGDVFIALNTNTIFGDLLTHVQNNLPANMSGCNICLIDSAVAKTENILNVLFQRSRADHELVFELDAALSLEPLSSCVVASTESNEAFEVLGLNGFELLLDDDLSYLDPAANEYYVWLANYFDRLMYANVLIRENGAWTTASAVLFLDSKGEQQRSFIIFVGESASRGSTPNGQASSWDEIWCALNVGGSSLLVGTCATCALACPAGNIGACICAAYSCCTSILHIDYTLDVCGVQAHPAWQAFSHFVNTFFCR